MLFPRIAPNAVSLGSDVAPRSDANTTKSLPECTRRDLNPHALRRRNLKANDASTEQATSRKDEEREDKQERPETAPGASGGDGETAIDVVEAALAEALTRASAAGQWTTVEVLSRELTARRIARQAPEVVDFDARRRQRET
jgi:hypothetical protein